MIYLVRHGEREWNRTGRMQGQLDSPPTERGQAQARAVGETPAELINGANGLALVASPLGLTMATPAGRFAGSTENSAGTIYSITSSPRTRFIYFAAVKSAVSTPGFRRR